MKKYVLPLAVCGAVLFGGLANLDDTKAAHKTVEYGASWTYGSEIVFTGRRGYSNLMSMSREHTSTVTIGQGSVGAYGAPGVESKASRIASYTATAYCYYNIW